MFIFVHDNQIHPVKERLVIIPTYNEKENIGKMVHTVFSLEPVFHLLVIDDHSPDGTADIVKELQGQYKNRLHLLERPGKLGLGTAYVAGFRWALEHDYRFIFEMDADFSHNPKDLVALYRACQDGADVSIGSRYKSGVTVVNWPLGRVLISYFASIYVRVITGMRVKDPTAGFVCYRREVLETMELDKLKFKGYAFQIEMKFTAWKYGFNIVEVPVIFIDRVRGKSKMSGGIVYEAMWGVIKMKVKSWFRKYRS